ncbi:hypothetical protein A1D31_06425 [Bradyrhizobium liaoningense]|nr:hypothetical protein A1D31_06425 [Bradyrhizobium liaoningense]
MISNMGMFPCGFKDVAGEAVDGRCLSVAGPRQRADASMIVMAGPVPAIHDLSSQQNEDSGASPVMTKLPLNFPMKTNPLLLCMGLFSQF